jgi:hypothetical protein
LLWPNHGEEQVTSARFANRSRSKATGDVVVVDGVKIVAFEAEVEETYLRFLSGDRVELNELVVVNLDEGLIGNAVFGEVEGLLKAKFGVEVAGSGKVVDADSYMSNACERRCLGLGFEGRDQNGEGDGKSSYGLSDGAGYALEGEVLLMHVRGSFIHYCH